jgi:hypothetical protein
VVKFGQSAWVGVKGWLRYGKTELAGRGMVRLVAVWHKKSWQ